MEQGSTQQIVPRRIVPFCLTADHRVIVSLLVIVLLILYDPLFVFFDQLFQDGKLGSSLWADFKKHLNQFTKEYEGLIAHNTSTNNNNNNDSLPVVQSKL